MQNIKLEFMRKMQTFKEFYFNNLLAESPSQIPEFMRRHIDVASINIELAAQTVKEATYIETFTTSSNIDLDVYRCTSGMGSIVDEFLTQKLINNDRYILSQFIYKVINNEISMTGIWQNKLQTGLARYIVFNYYLTRFNAIISDYQHTPQGEKYWKQLINDALCKNYKVYIIRGNNESVYDLNDTDLWGSSVEYNKIRIKIYAK